MTPAFAIVCALLAPSLACATILRVPEDFPTVADAVAIAGAGDVVLIACGTYDVDAVSVPSGVEVRGASRACVVLRGAENDPRFRVDGATGVIFADLTLISIKRGLALSDGASVLVSNCTIDGGAVLRSQGIDCSQSFLEIVDSQISGHRWENVNPRGLGLAARNSDVIVRRCAFTDNRDVRGHFQKFSMGAGLYSAAGTLWIEDSVFSGNSICCEGYGGALAVQATSFEIRRTLFVDNQAGEASVGAVLTADGASDGVLRQCTLAFNAANFGGNLTLGGTSLLLDRVLVTHATGGGSEPIGGDATNVEIVCSNLFGNQGGDWEGDIASLLGVNGNISADPLYCDPGSGDYGLDANSPSAPPASECGLMGAFPVACGTIGIETLTWGRLKSGYRVAPAQ